MTAQLAKQPPWNVLLVIRWPVGGIRTFVRYVFRNFDPGRWRFSIVAPNLKEADAMLDDLDLHDVRYIPLDERPGLPSFFFSVSREILRGGYDLVHSHGFTAGMCAAFPARLRDVPHLMTSHDVINASQFSRMKGRLKRGAMARLFNAINCIHSVSHDAQTNLLEYFPELALRKERLTVIPNGIEVERFTAAKPRNLRQELAVGEDVFLIGFFGRFMKQKGFRFLVKAVELLEANKDLHRPFLIVAFGEGGFIREDRQAIEEKGLGNRFRFMPFASNAAGAIKGVDVVAMPSLWEACGLLAAETLTCGIPLIGSNCIGLREVLRKTPARVVNHRDANALAEAIADEMKAPSKSLCAAFVEKAAERYDVKQRSMELELLYQELLSEINNQRLSPSGRQEMLG